MSLIASLPEIDNISSSVFVLHERSEKHIPYHKHVKGQLSYVEGGIAYLQIDEKYYVVPARHYFWLPQGMSHVLKIGHSGTVIRSLYFYTYDDHKSPFYSELGIYPINNLLMEMIKFSEDWFGHIVPGDDKYEFLAVIKNLLPEISKKKLPIALPYTENKRVTPILNFIEENISEKLSLENVSKNFGFSSRSLSRLFQLNLKTTFLQYLKLLRMVKAIELMLQTDLLMGEVAYAVGYSSLSAFSNTFYQHTNVRPSDFKRLY